MYQFPQNKSAFLSDFIASGHIAVTLRGTWDIACPNRSNRFNFGEYFLERRSQDEFAGLENTDVSGWTEDANYVRSVRRRASGGSSILRGVADDVWRSEH